MIMMGDRKKTVNAILGDGAKKREAEAPADALTAVMQEMIEAVKSGDASAAAAAFRTACATCSEPEADAED